MDLLDGLTTAVAAFGEWSVILAFFLGVLNGMVFGILPGLSGSVGIALMIPLTFGMGASEAMTLFVAALSGQTFAGSITAILLNTPGTSPNAATTFDGYPLARAGRGGFAIGISAAASWLGSLIGVLALIALFPVMRSVILAFSFPEFTMLGVLGIAAIALASRGSLYKGVLSGGLGLALAFIGFAPIGGDLRYVFGVRELLGGIDVIAVLIGLFALPEVIKLIVGRERIATDLEALRFGRRHVWEGVRYVLTQPFLLVRSSLLGTAIGIIPAVGGTVASFLAYFQASKTVKGGTFGRGDPRGVLAPEAANDGKDAGAALPSLAFGLPGSADWAIILGAMVIHGVQPGPNLIRERPDIVWIAILVILASSFVSSAAGLLFAPYLVQVTRARPTLLGPVVAVLAVAGAFALERQMFDVYVTVFFGILGYAMRQFGMPVIPLILGLILGETVERSFLQSLSIFGGPSVFVTRPVALVLLLLTLGILAIEVVSARRRQRGGGAAELAAVERATSPGSLLLVGFLGAVGLTAAVLAYDFSEDSRLFPLLVGWALAVLAAVYLAIALVPVLRRRLGAVIADTGTMEAFTDRQAAQAPDATVPGGTGGDGRRGAAPTAGPSAGTTVSVLEGQQPPAAPVGAAPAQPAPAAAEPTPSAPERDSRPAAGEPVAAPAWGLAATLGLLVLLAVAAAVVGLAACIPVFLVVATRVIGGESWRTTLTVTVVTSALLYLGFVELLGVSLGAGALFS